MKQYTSEVAQKLQHALLLLNGHAMARWSTLLLLVLGPVLVIPGFADPIHPIKRILLVVLMTFAALSWLLHLYARGSWHLPKSRLVYVPPVLLLGVLISALLSISSYASWVGIGSQGTTAALPFLALCILMALAAQFGRRAQDLRAMGLAALTGSALAVLLGWLLFLPSVAGWMNLPRGLTVAGTYQALAIISALMLTWFVGMWLTADTNEQDTWMPQPKWTHAFVGVGLIHALNLLVLMLMEGARAGLVVLLVGGATLTALALFDPKKFRSQKRLWAPILMLVVPLFFLLFTSPWFQRLPEEYLLDYGTSLHVAGDVLAEHGPFGSGPDTFTMDYLRFRPESVLETSSWQVQFDRGSDVFSTLLSTWGLLPVLLLAAFLIGVLLRLGDTLIRKNNHEDWQTIAVLGSTWVAALSTRFVYPPDTVLELLFWLLTGLLLARLLPKGKRVSLHEHSRPTLVLAISFVGAGILFVVSLALMVQVFHGEYLIGKAAAAQQEGDTTQVVMITRGATHVNRWRSDYARAEAVARLQHGRFLAAQVGQGVTPDQVLDEMNGAVQAARRAAKLDPFDADVAQILGTIYQSMTQVVQGASSMAIEGYRTAVKLDPVHPHRHLALARALLNAADQAALITDTPEVRQELLGLYLDEALEATEQAIALQPSYAQAYYVRTLVLERQGNLTDAIGQIEQLVMVSPDDPILRFELGVLHLRAGNKQKARVSFEAATVLSPTYANAKWYLSSLYEESGELDRAIELMQDLLILNPDDQVVQDKLRLLEQGIADLNASQTVPLESETVPVNTF